MDRQSLRNYTVLMIHPIYFSAVSVNLKALLLSELNFSLAKLSPSLFLKKLLFFFYLLLLLMSLFLMGGGSVPPIRVPGNSLNPFQLSRLNLSLQHLSLQHLSIWGIFQLLQTQFWQNFKGRFLWQSLSNANCHGDICPSNNMSWQHLSTSAISELLLTWFWPNFKTPFLG